MTDNEADELACQELPAHADDITQIFSGCHIIAPADRPELSHPQNKPSLYTYIRMNSSVQVRWKGIQSSGKKAWEMYFSFKTGIKMGFFLQMRLLKGITPRMKILQLFSFHVYFACCHWGKYPRRSPLLNLQWENPCTCMSLQNKITRSHAEFVPQRTKNNRGEWSLLTTGVNLWNAHLMGEKATRLLALRGPLMASLWGCGISLTG